MDNDLEEIDYGDDDFSDSSESQSEYNPEKQTQGQEPQAKRKAQDHGVKDEEDETTSSDNNLGEVSNEDDKTRVDGENSNDEAKKSDRTNADRCKYWPNCNAGDECSYYHPTKPCTAFPNCRFGNKCLYIHPPCKFNPNCVKPGCPFAHPLGTISLKRRAPSYRAQPLAPKCKFGLRCTNLMCSFKHQTSEPCRFGSHCLLDTCPYDHPTDVARKRPASAFKWTAQQ